MESDQDQIKKCREWIARRTAELDQREKQYADQYPILRPSYNLARLHDIEAERFWIDIHRWELEQSIKDGTIDDYPQPSNND